MSFNISDTDKSKLFRQARTAMGGGIRKIQLSDDDLLTFLEIAFEDYVEIIQSWLIEHQWASLIGLNITEDDIARAFITRTNDLATQYTYSYSKIVGLGAGEGGWELKKDFIELRSGQQIYQIPANREINEVMWWTPASLDRSVIDPFLGVWNNHFGGEYIGLGSYYIMPAYDILLRVQDRNLKNRIIRSQLIHKITNGPNGTKFLHLMNVPDGRFDFRGSSFNKGRVWYWYYDTSKNRDSCLEENKDIIKTYADVPLENIRYDDLNSVAKNQVRRYFIGKAKEGLGIIRGTFSGNIPVPNTETTMDYQMLLTQGQNEIEVVKQEIQEKLEALHPKNMLERMAEEARLLNETLKYRALPKPIRVI